MSTAGKAKRRKRSQLSMIWFRFRKNKLAMLGLIIFLMMIFIAAYVSIFGDYEKAITMDMPNKLQTPSAAHLFGTDQFGAGYTDAYDVWRENISFGRLAHDGAFTCGRIAYRGSGRLLRRQSR